MQQLLFNSSCFLLSADEVIHVNENFPERNGSDFFIHRVNEVRAGKEMVDQIKILLHHMVDTRDFERYKATLILGGNALLVEMPTVPFYLLHNVQRMYGTEEKLCQRSLEAHLVHANRIKADASLQVKTILLVFSHGMKCQDNAVIDPKKERKKVLQAGKVKGALRYFTVKYKSGKSQELVTQEYYPFYWLLRIVDTNRRLLEEEKEEEVEEDAGIDEAMAGMKIRGEEEGEDGGDLVDQGVRE